MAMVSFLDEKMRDVEQNETSNISQYLRSDNIYEKAFLCAPVPNVILLKSLNSTVSYSGVPVCALEKPKLQSKLLRSTCMCTGKA